MSNKRVNILYQCDNNFAFMAGVSVTSLLENADKQIKYDIYILTPDMSEENREKFYSLYEKYSNIDFRLTFLDATECEQKFQEWNVPAHRGSRVTYYKLLLQRFFEGTDVDQIIHIGADTLVLGTLKELADFDFHGKPLALNWSERLYQRYIPRNYHYCVAEMIYFNLIEWKKQNCEQRVIEHILKIGEIYGSKDEGIINMEFQHDITQLPLKYNLYGMATDFSLKNKRRFYNAPVITEQEIIDAYKEPQILHIARSFVYRPCEKNNYDPNNEIWWEYCNRSPWKGMEPLTDQPELGWKEKIFRKIYLHFPKSIAQWLYIHFRHLQGNLLNITHPARTGLERCHGGRAG